MESMALEVGLPVIVSMLVYSFVGWLGRKHVSKEVIDLEAAISDS